MLPQTVTRVSENTSQIVNMQLRQEMEDRVRHLAALGPEAIARRLQALDEEWDVERTLEVNAATLATVGAGLALLVDRRFAFLPLAVGAFLLQHAIQGWCPPLPILRHNGVRTQFEIEQERYALKAIQGDFNRAPALGHVERALRAVTA